MLVSEPTTKMKREQANSKRLGLLNVKLLFVCLIIAGVGVWFFYVREGSKGLPDPSAINLNDPIPDLRKQIGGGDGPQGNTNPSNPADPLGGGLESPPMGKQPDKSKLVMPMPPAQSPLNPSELKKVDSPPALPKKSPARSPREAGLEGKWLAKWSANGHDYTIEWDLKSNGSATGIRTQNGNPVGRFQFKWYVADDILVTEIGKTTAQFRHRPINANTFELEIISGILVAPGQSRIMRFGREL